MKLTDATAAKVELPDGKDEHFEWCGATPNFGVRLRRIAKSTTAVSRVWYCQYRVNGRQRRESLGDIRKVKCETARNIARMRFGKVAAGEDPVADKAAAKAEAVKATRTFGKMVEIYLKAKQGALRPASYAAAKRYLEKDWKPLHAKPIDSITRADIAERLRDLVVEHGRVSAARGRMNVSALFAWAIGEGMAESNPVSGTNAPDKNIKSRERVLDDDELRTIWQHLEDDTFGHIIKLLILNGCRRGEIGDLQWREINLETGVMTLPPERTKNGESLILTLAPASIAILKAIPQNKYRDDYIFGKQGKAGFNAWSWFTLALNARMAANGKAIAPWTIHDLRRSMRTGLSRIDVQPHVAELVIGHAVTGIREVYDKHKYQPQIKMALARWADHVEAVVAGRTSNVIDMKQHA